SRRRHTRSDRDWSSDVCSSDLADFTEDANTFTSANLSNYQAVVFLLTTGDVLDTNQQAAFQGFIQAGGGYVGVHSAADTERGWRSEERRVGKECRSGWAPDDWR